MQLPSISYLLESYAGVVRRFPIPAVVALIASVCCSIVIENNYFNGTNDVVDFCFKTLLACSIGFPLFITGVILKEAYAWSVGKSLIFNTLVLVFLVVFHIWFSPVLNTHDYQKLLSYVLFILSAHLSVSFVAYFRADELNDFWEFNRRLFVQFVIGALYCVLVFGGLSIAVLAVDELFNINVDDQLYGHIFIWTAGLLHTSYFLANFPKSYNFQLEARDFQMAFVNLVKYVFIPISILYFLILYAFTAKILVNWELPQGWVSSLVIGFSVAGIFTYLINYLLPQFFESGLLRPFRRWFFYILLPMVALLFVAIFRRIGDYGFTEERYYVLLTGIWLSFICLYFIFSKKDDIRVIPVSLLAFCVLSLVGPWSTFSVSKNSQKSRLEKLLTENGILQNGQIITHEPLLKGDPARDINNVLNYFEDREYWSALQDFTTDTLADKEKSGYEKISGLLKKFGVEKEAYRNYDSERIYYYDSGQRFENVDISNYQRFSPVYFSRNGESSINIFALSDLDATWILEWTGKRLNRFLSDLNWMSGKTNTGKLQIQE